MDNMFAISITIIITVIVTAVIAAVYIEFVVKKRYEAQLNDLKNQKKEQIPTGEVIKLHKHTYNMQFPPQIQSKIKKKRQFKKNFAHKWKTKKVSGGRLLHIC